MCLIDLTLFTNNKFLGIIPLKLCSEEYFKDEIKRIYATFIKLKYSPRIIKSALLNSIKSLNKKNKSDTNNEKFKDFVFVPTDKASNNISIVCKKFYVKTLLKEVGFFDAEMKQDRTYQEIKQTSDEIIKSHETKSQIFEVLIDEKQCQLPILLWTPKMHKNPSKQRFIAASHCCNTKNLSSLIGKCLKLIQKAHQVYCEE